MPALVSTFLFVEPTDNYLGYGSVPLHKIVEANRQSGQDITELMGIDANPTKIKEVLASKNPLFCSMIGHGSETIYTCQNLAPLLHAENPAELALMAERVVDLCSCLTATALGPALVNSGTVSYIGYRQEFWFYTGDAAGSTRAVSSPFLAEFQFVASILRGKSAGQARADQLAKYDEEIAYWTTGEGKDHADADEISRILELNKSISVFLGESNVAPSPQTGSVPSGEGVQINPAITIGVASVALGYVIYKTILA